MTLYEILIASYRIQSNRRHFIEKVVVKFSFIYTFLVENRTERVCLDCDLSVTTTPSLRDKVFETKYIVKYILLIEKNS